MSFLGIDVGTTGCKVAAFSRAGELLAGAYREYNALASRPGEAELPPLAVWDELRSCIAEVAARAVA